jgi:hypothetical protein
MLQKTSFRYNMIMIQFRNGFVLNGDFVINLYPDNTKKL